MRKRISYAIISALVAVWGLVACGGGGDGGGSPPPATQQPPLAVTAPRLTLVQQPRIQTAAVGEEVTLAVALVDCLEKTGTLCTKPGLFGTVNIKVVEPEGKPPVPVEKMVVLYNGQAVSGAVTVAGNVYTLTPSDPWNVSAAGKVEVVGKVSLSATLGSTATITLSATGAGGTVVTVAGDRTDIAITKSAPPPAVLSEATPLSVVVLGTGTLGSFKVNECPPAHVRCAVSVMGQTFTGTSRLYTVVTTTIGTGTPFMQWNTSTANGTSSWNVISQSGWIPGGTSAIVKVEGSNMAGSFTFTKLEMVNSKGEKVELSLPPPAQGCSSILSGLYPDGSCKR